jgi:hypothetical protein
VAFKGRDKMRTKILINEEMIEHVSNFKYLGCKISILYAQEDINNNLNKF